MLDQATNDTADRQEQTGVPVEPMLEVEEFHNMLEDIRMQPPWRESSDKQADYHDGNQIDPETMALLEKRGMGPLTNNIIAPIINVVLGMEAKTRADWLVSADDEKFAEVAQAQSAKIKEVERETRADMEISQAYAGQIKAGVGWVNVDRNSNPFEFPYRVEYIHRREVFWDWRDLTLELRKARYQMRKRWYYTDALSKFFPEHADLIQQSTRDPNRYKLMVREQAFRLQDPEVERAHDMEWYEEWRDYSRHRVCAYEVTHRVPTRGYVLRIEDDVVEFDRRNPMHTVLLARGMAKAEMAVYDKAYTSVWIGPHRVASFARDENEMPAIPFWGYREDLTGVPYGLVRAMISPQDEVNARRQKMMWLLHSRRLFADADAFDLELNDINTVMDNLSRPNAMIMLNPNRTNKSNAYTVESDAALASQQFEILQESKRAAQEVVGVFNAMLGNEGSANSGIAINSLVEQGMTALAEINDNYRYARGVVGSRLLSLIRRDMIGRRVSVVVDENGKKRVISLNTPTQAGTVENNVKAAKTKVALQDIPSTPSYRQQQFVQLTEVMKGMPPQLQAAIAPFYMEASDLINKKAMADALRKSLGQEEPKTPEEAAALQQQMRMAQQVQQKSVMLELEERQAKIDKLKADAEKTRADIGQDEQVNAIQQRARGQIDSLTQQLLEARQAADQGDAADPTDAIADLRNQLQMVVDTVARELAELRGQAAPNSAVPGDTGTPAQAQGQPRRSKR